MCNEIIYVYDFVSNPSIPNSLNLNDLGKIMLPVTGTLLGLVYAALIYWLQKGFSRLEHTRTLLEDLLIADGKILLDLLVGASVVSLFAIIGSIKLISVAFWIFAIVFLVDILKATAEQGYIAKIFSTKYTKYAGWLRASILFLVVICYPLVLSIGSGTRLWLLTENGAIIFICLSSIIALLQIKSLLTQAFDVRKQIDDKLMNENEDKATNIEEKAVIWSKEKLNIETMIISERLKSIGVVSWDQSEDLMSNSSWTSRDLHDNPVLKSVPWVKESGSCHFNIIIPYLNSDSWTREYIYKWSRSILETLSNSKTDVRQYSLSFFRKENEKCNHFGMIRASRDDIIKTLSQNLSDEEFIMNLPGRYLSPAVAEF
jgi:hypothetical protein